MLLVLVILFSALEGILSLSGGVLLLWKEKFARRLSFYLVNFAVGALLATAFLDLLPEALELSGEKGILALVLFGIFAYFLIERILLWHHAHHEEEEVHSFTYLVILGDTIHNFIDGVIIGAAFLVSPALGILTTFAVLLHEIPQEVGDFAILLAGGMKRVQIFGFNLFSSFVTVLGAVGAFFFGQAVSLAIPVLLALAAGGFIYIATVDLIPEVSKERNTKKIFSQLVLVFLGILVIFLGTKISGI